MSPITSTSGWPPPKETHLQNIRTLPVDLTHTASRWLLSNIVYVQLWLSLFFLCVPCSIFCRPEWGLTIEVCGWFQHTAVWWHSSCDLLCGFANKHAWCIHVIAYLQYPGDWSIIKCSMQREETQGYGIKFDQQDEVQRETHRRFSGESNTYCK